VITSIALKTESQDIIVLNLKPDMKDPKKVRWLTLVAALGLLSVGIDEIFFDRIVGGDPSVRALP
jgi:hypothetical protein